MSETQNKIGHHLSADTWRSADVALDETTFAGMQIEERVLKGLTKCNLLHPSPVQLQAIPLGRCGLDLVVQSKAGTGKTCIFAVVALEMVDICVKTPQALILTPTREIAVQVGQVLNAIGSEIKGFSCKTFIGGIKVKQDKDSLKKCHIAVGTPGRVKQLIDYGLLRTSSVRLLVLDEADKLMDDNFKTQINDIFSLLPESKQVIVTSATYPNELSLFLSRYCRDPFFVRLNTENLALIGVTQYLQITRFNAVNHLAFDYKLEPLFLILNKVSFAQCIIFSNYHARAQILCEKLAAEGWPTAYISGDQQQKERFSVMAKVKSLEYRVLVSTDLISRGVDCENINLVINLDVPESVETYLHRIGRAGRFGQKGIAITLATEGKEKAAFEKIQSSLSLNVFELPDLSSIDDLWAFHNPEIYGNTIRCNFDEYLKTLANRKNMISEMKNSMKRERMESLADDFKLCSLKSLKLRKINDNFEVDALNVE
ncbi:uncharacterized protein B4U79_15816 [Dinothrombium tinctorium]|uniref:RNA helicase n=1 Tax=Dinothrombium tinctorium TaxID=1965070 RepID=A0A3S3NSR9_9ACAR|nr:uncharacterized protein B4U79_15816 [Dinothrombium tinctorium]